MKATVMATELTGAALPPPLLLLVFLAPYHCSQGRGSGVNFALPADMVRDIVPKLIIYGTASGKGVRAG